MKPSQSSNFTQQQTTHTDLRQIKIQSQAKIQIQLQAKTNYSNTNIK